MNVRVAVRVLTLGLCALVIPAFAGQAFLDGEFDAWSFGTRLEPGPGGTASAIREETGGNPGARIHVEVSSTGPFSRSATALKHDYVTTAALEGATVVFSIEALLGYGNSHAIYLLVEQLGTLYVSPDWVSTGQPSAFTRVDFSSTLNAGGFVRISGEGPTQPNFGGNTPTRFGFLSGTAGLGAMYYDNARLELSVSPSPCSGFADVLDSDAFCGAVSWLANRSITLGCEANRFCPDSSVTRAQMALFMNRLGIALAPVVEYREGEYSSFTIAAGDPGTILCSLVPSLVVGDYPRLARVSGSISAVASNGPAHFRAQWKYSTDEGVSWIPMGTVAMQASAAKAGDAATVTIGAPPLKLLPGKAYRFAMFVDGMGTSQTFGPLKCQRDFLIFDASTF